MLEEYFNFFSWQSALSSMREFQSGDDTSDNETKPTKKDKGQPSISFDSVDALKSHMRGLNVSIYWILKMCILY